MKRIILMFLAAFLGYSQVQSVMPTEQVTLPADHSPIPSLWNQATYDYVIATDGDSGSAGTMEDPFDLQEVLDGTVSLTLNTDGPTIVVIRGGTYVYPIRGPSSSGYKFTLDGQTPPNDWAKSTSYSIGDQVRESPYSPHFWECTAEHTSGNGSLQDDVANWTYAHVPNHYILFRPYKNEMVYIDGGLVAGGTNIESGPEYIMWWGLNFYNNEFVVDWDTDGNPDTSVDENGDRFLTHEGYVSFPTNKPHDGAVTLTYGRECRFINSAAWAIGFGHGGTASEGQWWHGNTIYDQGWVTSERYHGPAFYQRNGNVTNNISGPVKEVWIDSNMMIENYSQQLQIYGTGGVALEMFVVQRNFAKKHPNSSRENFLGGGSRNFPQWTYPVIWQENVTYDCDQTIGILTGGDWLELHDNWVFSKDGEINRRFDVGSGQYDIYNASNNTDDPAEGAYVFLTENSFEYGRANLMIMQTWSPVEHILVDMDELFVSGDQWAIYNMAVHDPFAKPPVQTGIHVEGVPVAVDTNSEPDSFYVIRATNISSLSTGPDVSVHSNGEFIQSGSVEVQPENNTNFGATTISEGSITHRFQISNVGTDDLDLFGTPVVSLSGDGASVFSVNSQPGITTILPGGSTWFEVTFSPSSVGEWDATVSLSSNDPSGEDFTFLIKGMGVEPSAEISVWGNDVEIEDGTDFNRLVDHTEYGEVLSNGGSQIRTYTIKNDGTSGLTLGGVPNVTLSGTGIEAFSVSSQPDSSVIQPDSETTFSIIFDPPVDGRYTSLVTILSNDTDEAIYTFFISGTGISEEVESGSSVAVFGDEVLAESGGRSWYVSPSGSVDGDGTVEDPWELQSALFGNTQVLPGDTIWLSGGTYKHPDRSRSSSGYEFDLVGVEGAPITIRNREYERAIIDGGLFTHGAQYLIFQGLEILVSELADPAAISADGRRYSAQSGSNPTDLPGTKGSVKIYDGTSLKFVNNIIHDCRSGIGFWSNVNGSSEFYGNIIYRNGWIGSDSYYGTGMYTQNYNSENLHGDPKILRDNLFLENYAFPFQAYGSSSAYVENYHIEGNIFKSLAGSSKNSVVVGGERPNTLAPIQLSSNVVYGGDLLVGSADGGGSMIANGNTVIEGSMLFKSFSDLQEENNSTAPSVPFVFLRPNLADPRIAHLALSSGDADVPSLLVDFGSFLAPGDTFRILDPKDSWGSPVLQGTFDGSLVEISLSGESFEVYLVEKSNRIASGALEGSLNNSTDFGTAVVNGDATVRTYTIRNDGKSELRLTGISLVSVVGEHASDFQILTFPEKTNLSPGETTAFSLSFSPGGAGQRNATVEIPTNDADEGVFRFGVIGHGQTNPGPEITVLGNNQVISSGSTTTEDSNFTDFGEAVIGGQATQRTFTVRNDGSSELQLTGNPTVNMAGGNTLDFSIVSPLSDLTLPAGESATFAVGFSSNGVGVRRTTVEIESNDTNESIYSFVVEGYGVFLNQPPVLAVIGDKEVGVGEELAFDVTATDPETAQENLFFSLGEGSPEGASISPTGRFVWQPGLEYRPGEYQITVVVSDGGSPAYIDSEVFTVSVIKAEHFIVEPFVDVFSIGNVNASGSQGVTSYDDVRDTFTLNASGGQVWGKRDDFHFTYREITGDVEATVKVSYLSPENPQSQVGIMFRQSQEEDSVHAFLNVSLQGVALNRRLETGGGTLRSAKGNLNIPIWIKLVRFGDIISAYYSEDGLTWNILAENEMQFSEPILVGLAISSTSEDSSVSARVEQLEIKRLLGDNSAEVFSSADIGKVGFHGTYSFDPDNESFLIEGCGLGIREERDAFHFVYQKLNGDFVIETRLTDLTAQDELAIAGLMVREEMWSDSRYTGVFATNDHSILSYHRSLRGGIPLLGGEHSASALPWIKISRIGNTLTGEYSLDGQNWITVAELQQEMPDTLLVGMAVSSDQEFVPAYAEFSNLSLLR